MSKLSYQSIKRRCLDEFLIRPFHERTVAHGMTFGCGPAGYDIRVAQNEWISRGHFLLVSSVEEFNMPLDLIAEVKDKSTLARQGLAVQNTVIEPGWRGFLTLELTNHGQHSIKIAAGMPIAQIVFDILDAPTAHPYAGKYQDQKQGAQLPLFEKV